MFKKKLLPGSFRLHEIGDCHPLCHHFVYVPDLLPVEMNRAGHLAAAQVFPKDALAGFDGTFERFYDVADFYITRAYGHFKTAPPTLAAGEDSGPAQLEQDLRKIVGGDVQLRGDLLSTQAFAGGSQEDHGSESIFSGVRKHGIPPISEDINMF